MVLALSTLALADAQQLTVLRAVAKGSAPALTAALAADTADLFTLMSSQVRACGGWAAGLIHARELGGSVCIAFTHSGPLSHSHAHSPPPRRLHLSGCLAPALAMQLASSAAGGAADCKLFHYARYKAAFFSAYAHCFNGITLWKQQDRCGAGLKSLEAAAAQLAAAKRAAAVFDASPPVSLNLAHRCGVVRGGGAGRGGGCKCVPGWEGRQQLRRDSSTPLACLLLPPACT